jgi:MOSC domain-containing protein YiiM
MGTIHCLTYQTSPSEHKEPYHYNRTPADCLRLIAGHGIEGDFKAGRNPKRQLNVMALESLQALSQEGWHVGPGEMGEQIVLRGVDLMALAPGSRLRLGDSAVIEINFARTGCDWLAAIQSHDPQDAANRLGMMASVIESGDICVGAPVAVIHTPEVAAH